MKWKCPSCGDSKEGWCIEESSVPSDEGLNVAVQCQGCLEYFWLEVTGILPYSEG